MKKFFLFSTTCLFALVLISSFIPADCLQQYWGAKTLYPYHPQTETATPAGYRPVFINYAGRHGARHVTNLKEALFIAQLLSIAERENALTDSGIALRKMIAAFLTVETKDNNGLLTGEGEDELYSIGHRMAASYPVLFGNKNTCIVAVTKEKRTMQSAVCFMKGLGRPMDTDKNIVINENDSVHLRFFELATAYRQFAKSGAWTVRMEKLKHTAKATQVDNEISHRFFKNNFADKILGEQLDDTADNGTIKKYKADKISDAIFSVASGTNALQKEIKAAGLRPDDLNIRSLLTCDEFAWLEFVNSAKEFLLKGPGMDINGIQVRNAVPLLVDFLNSTDSCIAAGIYAANLRFAHAETMAPFAALLEINGAATPATDIFDYNKNWQSSYAMPFGANVQWVIYKNDDAKKDVLIKILYNESPVKIPVPTSTFPYYKWKDVKGFYSNKLARYRVGLHDDMYQYLLHIK